MAIFWIKILHLNVDHSQEGIPVAAIANFRFNIHNDQFQIHYKSFIYFLFQD